jgi:hypothetical protein
VAGRLAAGVPAPFRAPPGAVAPTQLDRRHLDGSIRWFQEVRP